MDQLPAGSLHLAERLGDFVMVGIEYFAQQEGRAGARSKAFQHGEECNRDVVTRFSTCSGVMGESESSGSGSQVPT